MEEQPHHHHHHHHYYYYGHHHHHPQSAYLPPPDGRAQPKPPLRHEHKHGGPQHTEAPKRRPGYGELNGNAGEREVSLKGLCSDEATTPGSRVPNGSQQLVDTNVTPKQTVKASALGKAGIKTKNFIQKNSMDKKNEKSYENKHRENQSSDKPEGVSIPNGVVTNNSSYITNGYVGKGADNDGSGSESGYTTPKKRKGRRNSAKGCENLNLVQDKIMQQEVSTSTLKQELESFKPDYSEQKGNRIENIKPVWKYEAGAGGAGRGKPGLGDVPRKNSDAKPGISSKKFDDRPKGKHTSSASSKEDSWTLFKPPPVFPVDNSSAKIVPKISYASKVKENLNKAAQTPSTSSSSSSSSAGETQAQTSSRLSQVPMSAMKSVTSASFSNGPILAGTDGSVYSPGTQPLLSTAASTVPSTSSESVPQDMSTTSTALEQKKSGLFIYPSNMQTVLLGTAQVDFPSQTNQQNLGDIFQNQWGLSFINEPSAGPETVVGKSADNQLMEVTFQGEYPATLVSQRAEIIPSGTEQPVFPKAYELDKRTSPQILSAVLKPGTAVEGGVLALESHHTGDLQKADTGSQGALVFLSKDYEVENPLASPTNNLLASAKEQRYQRGLERKDSWGSFDLRAAILYHTKEMEAVWNLQKQDPKRIITYDEAMDRPDQ
ncbi:PREDICTED: nuclear fragile X mental retardation-interacting protein 2 [Pseudopodoces humilis]|uniref:nuclear fragile X mental retardation-interacting protein 2 n=1 Tax=Pseudopodoces humilis TaxID=181119 RepID=UPI00039591A4|nr:PREDICTED: nuclear fragile X mental retardation-interacting protein 2 [Pseudopodoces humilis]XP_014110584.1 PREDICTED: nuclear fragile X mental retardation-interacting protein 2 [Pseudopodoces humilis]